MTLTFIFRTEYLNNFYEKVNFLGRMHRPQFWVEDDGISLKFYRKAKTTPCPSWFFKFLLQIFDIAKYGIRVSEALLLNNQQQLTHILKIWGQNSKNENGQGVESNCLKLLRPFLTILKNNSDLRDCPIFLNLFSEKSIK